MKRLLVLLLLALVLFGFSGCDSWMDGEYYSVTPHLQEHTGEILGSMEVTDYSQLQQTLSQLVRQGAQESVIYAVGMDTKRLDTFMNMAVNHVMLWDAMGNYAVEDVQYDVGTNAARTAIAVKITYNRSRSEILRIKHVQDMDAAKDAIYDALCNCEPGVVILTEGFKTTDFVQLVQDYVDLNPEVCMEMPQVTAAVYPETGTERVIDMSFAYQTSRETLRIMQNYVEPVFRAAILNVSGEEEEATKFERMYSFLMERNDYQVETSLTPSYSLLRHGVGDSKAFATVYSAMCRSAELECQIVSGTREGEPWTWNLICEDGQYYHVDLLRSEPMGSLLRLTDAEMRGYVWDYTAYPETGSDYHVSVDTPVDQTTEQTDPQHPQDEVPEPSEPTETQPEQETVASAVQVEQQEITP